MSRTAKAVRKPDEAESSSTEPRRDNAWELWRDLSTEDAVVATETDKARMIERHKLVVNIIEINSQQLRCESAKAGLDIERACALRDADQANTSPAAQDALADLDRRMAALTDESKRLDTQREFLNASLMEFDGGSKDPSSVGRA